MASNNTSYGDSAAPFSTRNSRVSLISGASCGSFAARVSIARRKSNGGISYSIPTMNLQSGNGANRLANWKEEKGNGTLKSKNTWTTTVRLRLPVGEKLCGGEGLSFANNASEAG